MKNILFLAAMLFCVTVFGQCPGGVCRVPQTPEYRINEENVNLDAVLRVRVTEGTRNGATTFSKGSGAVVRWGNAVVFLTAYHVVQDAPNAVDVRYGNQWFPIQYVYSDPVFDFAIYTAPEVVEPLEFGVPNGLESGMRFLAGGFGGNEQKVKFVTIYRRMMSPNATQSADWMEFDGAAVSGDSGGPILTTTGTVIGVLWGSEQNRNVTVATHGRRIAAAIDKIVDGYEKCQYVESGLCRPPAPQIIRQGEIKAFEAIIASAITTVDDKAKAKAAIPVLRQRISESNQKELEASPEFKKAEKQRADAIKNLATFEESNLTEAEKWQQKLQQEREKYMKALSDKSKLEDLTVVQMESALEELERREKLGYGIYNLEKEIEAQKRKELDQLERLNNLRKMSELVGPNQDRAKQMFEDEQKKILGNYSKYFDQTGKDIQDYGQKFKTAGEELIKAGNVAGKTAAELLYGLDNMMEEMKKDALAKAKQLTSGIGMPSAATYGSAEAYKVIAGAKDPTVLQEIGKLLIHLPSTRRGTDPPALFFILFVLFLLKPDQVPFDDVIRRLGNDL